jgi:hypothetical protein
MTMYKYALMTTLAALSTGMMKADTVTYTAAASAGRFTYNFALANTGGTGGSIFDLFLSLPTAIGNVDTTTIGTPAGWGDPTGGLLFYGPDVTPTTSFVEWSSDASGAFDLAIGQTRSGFAFDTSFLIDGPIRFALNGSTDFTMATPSSAVPEPSSIVLLVSVCAFGIGWRLRWLGLPSSIFARLGNHENPNRIDRGPVQS